MGTAIQRLDTIEGWSSDSHKFHIEMRSFKDTMIAEQDAMRKMQTRRHESNATKLNIVMVLFAFMGLVLTAVGILVSYAVTHHALNDLVPKISLYDTQVEAHNGNQTQDAVTTQSAMR